MFQKRYHNEEATDDPNSKLNDQDRSLSIRTTKTDIMVKYSTKYSTSRSFSERQLGTRNGILTALVEIQHIAQKKTKKNHVFC